MRDNELHPDEEDAARARNELNLVAATRRWRSTLQAATRAIKVCPGRVKLDEAVAILEQQQLFNINASPMELPAGDQEFIKRFDLPSSLQGFSKLAALRIQWGAHRASWTAPVAAPLAAAPAAGQKRKRELRNAGAPPVIRSTTFGTTSLRSPESHLTSAASRCARGCRQ